MTTENVTRPRYAVRRSIWQCIKGRRHGRNNSWTPVDMPLQGGRIADGVPAKGLYTTEVWSVIDTAPEYQPWPGYVAPVRQFPAIWQADAQQQAEALCQQLNAGGR